VGEYVQLVPITSFAHKAAFIKIRERRRVVVLKLYIQDVMHFTTKRKVTYEILTFTLTSDGRTKTARENVNVKNLFED